MNDNPFIFETRNRNDRPAQHGEFDAGVIFLGKGEELPEELGIPALAELVRNLRESGTFTGAQGQVEVVPTLSLLPIPFLVLAGVGDGLDREAWRIAAALAGKVAIRRKFLRLAVSFQPKASGKPDKPNSRSIAFELTEGFLLGSYRVKSYKRDQENSQGLQKVVYLISKDIHNGVINESTKKGSTSENGSLEQCLRKAALYAEATNYARDLTNLPGNELVPRTLAKEAMKLAGVPGMSCTVLDEQEIFDQGFGGLHHVGKGSSEPPRMIVIRYQGKEEWTDVLGLVGKGITFDTGGISMKKPEGMEEMISDMGGAATLLGVMQVLGQLQPKINVVAVIPAAENMPSGNAYKPGDVIPTLSGRTVEVLNTDAEGRIVLADGVTYALRLGASKIIDVATLTGAVLIALGDVASMALTNDEGFLQELLEASKKSGEKVWQLPAYPDYWDMLKSDVADVRNSTGSSRWAGAITAGLFIGVFAENTPWIHLDTGGTAWLWSERGIDPKGGTGVMVRTLLEMIVQGS